MIIYWKKRIIIDGTFVSVVLKDSESQKAIFALETIYPSSETPFREFIGLIEIYIVVSYVHNDKEMKKAFGN